MAEPIARRKRTDKYDKPVTDPAVRFARKYEVDQETGCWLWRGPIYPNGYGSFSVRIDPVTKKWGTFYAHRISYELHVGPIPAGLQLDHLCRVRNCVNPEHLDAVTGAENRRRGINRNREKTHCKHGHPFSPGNTYVETKDGKVKGRKCVICTKASATRSYRRKKAEMAA